MSTPEKITAEFLDRIVAELTKPEFGDPGEAALSFVREKRDILVGMATEPLVNLLKSLGEGTAADYARTTRNFVDALGTADDVNQFYTASVETLEKSAKEPLRLGSFLKSLASYGARVAPTLFAVLTKVIGV